MSGFDSSVLSQRRRRKLIARRADELAHCSRQIFVVTMVLLALGMAALFSASTGSRAAGTEFPYWVILRQLLFTAIGVGLLLFTWLTALPKLSSQALKLLVALALITNLVLLICVFIPPFGVEAGGAYRWLRIGGLQFQPAEFLKLTLILFIATALVPPGSRQLVTTRQSDGRYRTTRRKGLRPAGVIALILLCIILTAIQPDLGTTALLLTGSFAVLALAGVSWRALVGAFLVLLLIGGLGLLVAPQKYQYAAQRLLTMLHPSRDVSGPGYQITQSLVGISQGGLLGRGYMQSQQKLGRLPLADRDFIFAVWVEEMGLLSGALVLGLFLYLLFLCWRAAALLPFGFEGVAVFSLGFVLSLQAAVNIGTNVGLLPVSGLTLPFFSSGGSSLLVSLLMVAVVLGLLQRARAVATKAESADEGS